MLPILQAAAEKVYLQAEYDHAVFEAKKLAVEFDSFAPDHIRERIKSVIKYAAYVLIMMNVPKPKIAGKLLEDFDGGSVVADVAKIYGQCYIDDLITHSTRTKPARSTLDSKGYSCK